MTRGVVVKDTAAIKLMPDINSELADEAFHGMVLEIVERRKDPWYKVRTAYDYYGYVSKWDLLISDAAADAWDEENYSIWRLTADVMARPDYASRIMTTLVRGCLVRYTGIYSGKWEQIGLADGSRGWIRRGFARFITKLPEAENEEKLRKGIVETALDYLGAQYRWGGKSQFGIDCSGLSWMAYMMNGWLLPRDSGRQQSYLKAVNREEAKPGDLLFFPGHVAIYIGNGRYVHSTGREGYVLINSLNKGSEDYREDHDKSQTGTGTLF